MFASVIGADVGSQNTRLALKSGCVCEKTLASYGMEAASGGRMRSTLDAAGNFERSSAAPVRNGRCANIRLLSLELSALSQKHLGRRGVLRGAELYYALPKTMPFQRVRAFERAAEEAGFRSVRILERMLMGALGAGEDIEAGRAGMIVDIGAQTVCCAAFGFGGIIYECCESFGSERCDRAIRNYFASAHGVHIGSRTAELIKMNLGRLGFTVDGRSVEDGLPRAVRANAEDIRACALTAAGSIVSLAADMLRHIPVEVCADILDSGVTLIGGGAKMEGLGELFEAELGVPARVAENAETAAADGMRMYLFSDKAAGKEGRGEGERARSAKRTAEILKA